MTPTLLTQLLTTPGPSGAETAVAALWREHASSFADVVYADVHGNSYAAINPDAAPHLVLTGHIDEIGLMIVHIDERGYLFFGGVGDWDPQVLVGQRVRFLTREPVLGVVGKKPIHQLDPKELDKACGIKDLWIDIGVSSREEALKRVQVGDVGVLDGVPYTLPEGRIIGRAMDNRVGAYVVLEALRRLAARRPTAQVTALAAAQEETSQAGAGAAAFRLDPDMALVIDVTPATDQPDADQRRFGAVTLGGGPVLTRGASNSPAVYQRLLSLARASGRPYQVEAAPATTFTDAEIFYRSRGGVATGLISIPCRYLHSPNEMVSLDDLEGAIELLVAFAVTGELGSF